MLLPLCVSVQMCTRREREREGGREREGEGGREDGPMNIIFILRLRSREMKRRHSLLLLLSVSLVLVDRTTNAGRQFRQGPARNKKKVHRLCTHGKNRDICTRHLTLEDSSL